MTDDQKAVDNQAAAPRSSPSWDKTARYAGGGLLLIGLILLVVFVAPVGQTIALGFIISFLMYIPIRALVRHTRLHYSLVVILLFVLLVVVVVLIIAFAGNYVVSSLENLSSDTVGSTIEPPQPPNALGRHFVDSAAKVVEFIIQESLALVGSMFGLIGLLFVALFFSLLLMLGMGQWQGVLRSWVPSAYQAEMAIGLRKLDQIWVGYIQSQVIYGSVLAVASFFQFKIMGVPYPFILAILTGLISLIPTIGGLLSSALVGMFALLLGSTVYVDMPNGTFALLVTLVSVIVTQVSYNFIALPIVGKFVRLPTVVVLVGVLAGVAMGSVLVAFLAVPILATLRILGGYLLAKILRRDAFPDDDVPGPEDAGFFSQFLLSS